ncbi:MAG: V-type ATP synthase subunit F [Firmicutes bacterium]|nr:V-type ATP synthase subunit F [Bacillota bacterium]
MSTYKIGVIGDKDSILGFKTLGVAIFPVVDAQAALSILKQVAKEDYAVLFITEELAQQLEEPIAELNKRFLPVVVPIPNNKGTLGIGMSKIKESVEKAIGADILFRKEG